MKRKLYLFNYAKLFLFVSFFQFIILVISCNSKSPSFQWFLDKKIGIRICETKMQNNQIVFKINILNKSGKNIELDNPGFDFDGLMYMFLDEETNKRYQNKEAVVFPWGKTLGPDENLNIYYYFSHTSSQEDQYRKIKAKKSGELLFEVCITINDKHEKFEIINIP